MQPYIRNENLSIQGKILMFKIKNRLITNLKKKYKNNLKCRLCSCPEESQAQLIECNELMDDKEVQIAFEGFAYKDLFSTDLETQTHMTKAWQQLIKVRKINLKKALQTAD